MNVEITGRHVIITPAIRSYILKRLRKFSKILGDNLNFHVVLGVEKDRHTAEIILKSKSLDVTGTGETKDMYSSIIRVIDKLERQALKSRQKQIETKRHIAKAKSVVEKSALDRPVGSLPPRGSENNGITDEEAPKKPMMVEEAVLQLGQSENPFVVFRNAESGKINVLYRRKDGSLGLIHI